MEKDISRKSVNSETSTESFPQNLDTLTRLVSDVQEKVEADNVYFAGNQPVRFNERILNYDDRTLLIEEVRLFVAPTNATFDPDILNNFIQSLSTITPKCIHVTRLTEDGGIIFPWSFYEIKASAIKNREIRTITEESIHFDEDITLRQMEWLENIGAHVNDTDIHSTEQLIYDFRQTIRVHVYPSAELAYGSYNFYSFNPPNNDLKSRREKGKRLKKMKTSLRRWEIDEILMRQKLEVFKSSLQS